MMRDPQDIVLVCAARVAFRFATGLLQGEGRAPALLCALVPSARVPLVSRPARAPMPPPRPPPAIVEHEHVPEARPLLQLPPAPCRPDRRRRRRTNPRDWLEATLIRSTGQGWDPEVATGSARAWLQNQQTSGFDAVAPSPLSTKRIQE